MKMMVLGRLGSTIVANQLVNREGFLKYMNGKVSKFGLVVYKILLNSQFMYSYVLKFSDASNYTKYLQTYIMFIITNHNYSVNIIISVFLSGIS